MFYAWEQFMFRHVVAPQLVGHEHPWHVLQALQKSPEEALRRVGITPGLNEDVENNAILVDGAPQIVLHALDPDEDFVHVPFVSRAAPAAAQAVGETRSEFLAPAPYCLIGDNNPALSQKQLNIPQTEAKDVVQPDSVANDLGREPMTIVRIGRRLHALTLARLQVVGQTRLLWQWPAKRQYDIGAARLAVTVVGRGGIRLRVRSTPWRGDQRRKVSRNGISAARSDQSERKAM
jgi:hypothetical protein